MIDPSIRTSIANLFQEFLASYPATEEGRTHIAFYASGRDAARANFEEICAAADRGEEITDAVLLKLLPYADSQSNHEAGAWIHIAPTIHGNIKKWYEAKEWTQADEWPLVARRSWLSCARVWATHRR